ncbi:MAG: hypothetical protein JW997_03510 [Actinobacteria bacterium]|nr:hypothetical protein [Actinomycetota bacterium]
MRFADYKCRDCGIIDEYVISSGSENLINCSSCGSSNTVRVFSPVSFKASFSAGDSQSHASYSKSCAGRSCSTCSGCS